MYAYSNGTVFNVRLKLIGNNGENGNGDGETAYTAKFVRLQSFINKSECAIFFNIC